MFGSKVLLHQSVSLHLFLSWKFPDKIVLDLPEELLPQFYLLICT